MMPDPIRLMEAFAALAVLALFVGLGYVLGVL